jgi:hypothetical protein
LQTYNSPAIVGGGTGQPGQLSQSTDPSRAALIGVGVVGLSVLIVVILLLVIIL